MSDWTRSFEACNVIITRENHDSDYVITALNTEGKVAEFTAGALNINGYAFATSGLDIGEYERSITVKKDEGSRYVDVEIGESQ